MVCQEVWTSPPLPPTSSHTLLTSKVCEWIYQIRRHMISPSLSPSFKLPYQLIYIPFVPSNHERGIVCILWDGWLLYPHGDDPSKSTLCHLFFNGVGKHFPKNQEKLWGQLAPLPNSLLILKCFLGLALKLTAAKALWKRSLTHPIISSLILILPIAWNKSL